MYGKHSQYNNYCMAEELKIICVVKVAKVISIV